VSILWYRAEDPQLIILLTSRSHIHQLVTKSDLQARLAAAGGVAGSDDAGSTTDSSSGPGSADLQILKGDSAAAAIAGGAEGSEQPIMPSEAAEGTIHTADQAEALPASPNDRPPKRTRMVD
jgi:hypothetical protein